MSYQKRLFICDRSKGDKPHRRYCGAEYCEDCEYTADPNHAVPEKEFKYYDRYTVPIYLVGIGE